ncbi:uncharacterized protein LOC116983989 [Amblyraja radiata]|uniref:uncharacterized protein LOC116983989 n=1 Tax=Amblyraja radiata TaxID=386614 RepID=UPI001402E20A|nr:uncharacterized protein LOC116983989 [Amblyraja radiata]
MPIINVALGGSPTQSSTEQEAGAERAIDGNSDSDFWHGSCARTRKSKDPWWRVDLKESYYMSEVRITVRADCCSDQLLGAELRIGDSLENDGNSNRRCGTFAAVALTTLTFNCDGFEGQYVNIFLPGQDKILTLCEVEIFASESPQTENVALRMRATQSSIYEGAVAERANDGNIGTDLTHGSCARTRKSKNPWWRVDLKESYNVSDVRITNRADCCSDELLGAEIRIGDSLENDGNSNTRCGIVYSVAGTTLTFNCGGIVGQYVNIVIPGPDKTLTLCQVEIFGSELPLFHGKENLALGASPIQSSTDEGAVAERANDGNSDSDFRHGSCSRTSKSKNPWWRVDLNETYLISDIRITNRADCCSDQLQGAEIRIGDSLEHDGNFNRLCGIVDSVSWKTLTFYCGGIIGRYVNVIIPGPDKTLTLCEVEIFVKLSHPTENVALGASPTQSSTDEGAAAEGANDGNSDNDFRHGSCSRTRKSKNPWWRADLTESFNVSDVIIINRADCCSDQLQGAEIRIGDSLENEGNSNRL